MRSELIIKSRSLGGSSDLTLLAPIKTGLVPSLEAVTYKTRIKRLLKTLNAGRTSSHEYALMRAFSDAVERVGKIHSVRVAIVEPDKLLLSVNFDGGWESYLRVLWQKVGTLLDLIFCNTEGYVCSWDHRFEEWANWVWSVQIETGFFYGMPGLTVDDVQYLRKNELLSRQEPGSKAADLSAVRLAVESAERQTWSLVGKPGTDPRVTKELGRQGLRALAVLYRLTSYYLPASSDGEILHRAARDLLYEFVHLAERHALDDVLDVGKKRFSEQIGWLLDGKLKLGQRMLPVPQLPKQTPRPDDELDVQGGIIEPFPTEFAHGCLLLIAFGHRAAAAKFIDSLGEQITRAKSPPEKGEHALNVALTCEGLRAMGLTEAEIALFPQEFREGMEARASLLGDLRTNHPNRWRLPERNWKIPADAPALAVELSEVHMVVQLRVVDGPPSLGETLDPSDPLWRISEDLVKDHPNIKILSVQPLVRHFNDDKKPMEHFGFADGDGQPVLDPKKNGKIYDRNQVQLGEFLLGYPNQSEASQVPEESIDPALEGERRAWLHNGSFLVVRKLSQAVDVLNEVVAAASKHTKLPDELILAKMMGRWRDGRALTALSGSDINDFDYVDEKPPGSLCPFHAHIRRANPRVKDDPNLPSHQGGRFPRLMRRSMSYGPLYRDDPNKARGLVFMAYNASISEQFEVVQRWISGGNSAGGFSGQSDPFFGVPQSGQRRIFRFEHENEPYRIMLDGDADPLWQDRPLVRLEWGAYLFTPSLSALRKLAETGRRRAEGLEKPVWSVADGLRRISELRALELAQGTELAANAWKALLEDPEAQSSFDSAGVWAGIRSEHGGVLRTPYGVIVADRHFVNQVLRNEGRMYSVAGYHRRMLESIGEIYLGMDDQGEGCPYRVQSDPVNAAIALLNAKDAFTLTRNAAKVALEDFIKEEKRIARGFRELHWELNLDLKELVDRVLETLCQQWFGLPAGECEVQPGGARWDWKLGEPPLYPGHFTAPSRYLFQPRPGQTVEAFGVLYGQALKMAFYRLVKQHRDELAHKRKPVFTDTQLTKAILDAFPRRWEEAGEQKEDVERDELAARTIVGAMMGFLPTVDGNLRLSLNEWLRDGNFWSLRMALASCGPNVSFESARDLLEPTLKKTMQLRPSPELVWRTATREHRIGSVPVYPGDTIVVSIVSATQQCLETGDMDVSPIFGGNRGQHPHPTHACPGYHAAMGVLLGFVTALLEFEGSMRPSAAPLALTFEGNLPPDPGRIEEIAEFTPGEIARIHRIRETAIHTIQGVASISDQGKRIGEGHRLVADGDSWVCYLGYKNLAAHLEDDHGFEVNKENAENGSWLYDFYDDDRNKRLQKCTKGEAQSGRIDRLCKLVNSMVDRRKPPIAIIFSAGGNDVVKGRLTELLNKKGTGKPPLDEDGVSNLVDGLSGGNALMRCWLEAILDRLKRECVVDGKPIPVFLHGYDFPVPDGRYAGGGFDDFSSWLWPSFYNRGYVTEKPTDNYPIYPVEAVPIMQALITRLNDMQAAVAGLPRFKDHVFHVRLTDTRSNTDPRWLKVWDNELHPNDRRFGELTKVLVAAMTARISALQQRS